MNQPTKVLVVDQDRCYREQIARALATANFKIFQAETGGAALAQARREIPDLVLLGVNLPDLKDAQLYQCFAADPALVDVFVIQATANFEPDQGKHGLELGFDHSIPSPIEDEELLERLECFSRIQRAEAGLRREAERLSAIIVAQQEIAAAAPEPVAIMNLVATRAQRLTHAEGATIELVEGDEMVYRAASGIAASQLGLRLNLAASFSGLGVRTEEILRCDDTATDPRVEREAPHFAGIRSAVVVPLRHQYNSMGILKVVSGKPSAFGEADIQTLQLVAHFMAVAINQAVAAGAKQALLAEHTRTILALKESEERFRNAFDYAAIGMALVGLDGQCTKVNQPLCEIVGYSQEELLARSVHSFTHAEDVKADREHVRQLLAGGVRTYQQEMRYYHKSGSIVWVLLNVSLLRNSQGQALYFIAQVQDITERKRAEEALIMQARVLQNMSEGVCLTDENGVIVYTNAAEEAMFGYGPTELIGQPVTILNQPTSEENARLLAERNEQVQSQGIWSGEFNNQKKDGRAFTTSASISLLKVSGRKYFVYVQEDITEKKRADEQIKNSLKEKDVLLKEIHHRVKNNLQVISSLLNLQAGYIQDKRTHELFRDSQNRVRSMALIHEKLYQSQDLAKIDFGEYVLSLIAMLFRSYGTNSGAVKLDLAIAPVFLSIDTAIPIGLVINELVSNSLKYAFPNGRAGTISIDFQPTSKEFFTLVFRDDGIGVPKEFNVDKSPSLGLRLVRILTKQIGGELTFERNGGTEFKISFGEQKEKDRN